MAGHSALAGVDENGVILNGYGAVTYLSQNESAKGSKDFKGAHDGAINLFSSAKHRNGSSEDPKKPAPQYNGWNACGAALGKTFHGDGKAFEVRNGKLYVNLDGSIQKKWVRDWNTYSSDVDRKWPSSRMIPANPDLSPAHGLDRITVFEGSTSDITEIYRVCG